MLSGSPIAHAPYVESARYAAEARNYWWQHVRATSGNVAIEKPPGVGPYPSPKVDVNDKPADDAGGNFGRIPRLKDSLPEFKRYLDAAILEPVAGIEARHWINFFKGFTDDHDADETFRRLQDILQKQLSARSAEVAEEAAALLRQLIELLKVS